MILVIFFFQNPQQPEPRKCLAATWAIHLGTSLAFSSMVNTFFVNQFFVVLTVSFPVRHLHHSECVFVCLSVSLLQRCRFLLFPMWVSVRILSSNLSCNLGVDVSRICLVSLCALFLSSGQSNPSSLSSWSSFSFSLLNRHNNVLCFYNKYRDSFVLFSL
jgi:hypothetical protein